MSSVSDPRNIIWVYSLAGVKKNVIANPANLRIEERIFELQELSFTVRSDDPKAADLKSDIALEFGGDRYFIYQTKNVLSQDGVRLKTVKAEINWMVLGSRKRHGDFILEDVSVTDGLTTILDGKGWAVGLIDPSLTGTFSYEGTDMSVLQLIWEWCRVIGGEPIFNSLEQTVSIVPFSGKTLGVSFRYGRDVQEIEKEEISPEATRVLPFGRDDLNVIGVAGVPYVEDFSWYTSQGIDLVTAQARYSKEEVFYDDSIIDDTVLHEAGLRYLSRSSKPVIKYKAKVLDLSAISQIPFDLFNTGDMATIYDEDISSDVDARITRRVVWPNDPSQNSVELSFNAVLLPEASVSNARSSSTKSWELFVSRNELTARKIQAFSSVLHRIKLRHVTGAEWVMGYSLSGVASGNSEMTIEFVDSETDTPVWETQVVSLTDGQEYDYAWTFGRKDIPAGTTTVVVRAYLDTPGSSLDIVAGSTALWVLARGTTRQTVTLPNSITFEYTGDHQYWTVPDDVHEILITAYGGSGGSNTSARGLGGEVEARFPVVPGSELEVNVGGGGAYPGSGVTWPNGGSALDANSVTQSSGAGGGSSDVRPVAGGMADTLIVAAGGGGKGQLAPRTVFAPGHGGFYNGLGGHGHKDTDVPSGITAGGGGGGGATQEGPGIAVQGYINGYGPGAIGVDGSFGVGANAVASGNNFGRPGGGGGGGYYGGASGATDALTGLGFGDGETGGDGGGGSGWMRSDGFDLFFQDGSHTGDGRVIISWETPADVG